ncbi:MULTISPECIES: diguanylate cyclase domain-containing protein [Methylomonas]|uniref:diguanylate cyclase n=2 Tax=Methylomonas TaxID=416 RepID=A0A126T9B8_9GAMM|nr:MULTISPECIES: diguanylate cyclase [Methylomonas]AMK78628.1 diguanylate cyclase response regulator [Methylomonas denitrificans]OAI03629.1 diguanylate cyclase response regulator [Methylomonas methanica]TCV83619.1 response regulator receiver modulated diguanylate cyclase [Methylomonas methanica]
MPSIAHSKPRILIVDDIPNNVEVLGDALAADNQVQFATSGLEGLALAESYLPDLIFLDVMMPEMDGFEVCKRLKSNNATRHIPVIFVTAKDSDDDEGVGLTLGAVDYIKKPFNPALVRMRAKNHIEFKRRADLLESFAMIDALTHLSNRRRFDEQLELEWKRSQRERIPLSVLIMDIDYFKQFNDHYGHGGGDTCLQNVARAMKSALNRPTDFLARYGGEEFVAILPQTDEAGAVAIGERIRLSVETLKIPHRHSLAAPIVTISVGAATYSPIAEMPDASALLQAADQQLYQAKANGRNCVASN